jgi:hypothetical protein
MDNKELIEQVLESQGLKPEQISEIIAELSSFDGGVMDPTVPANGVGIRERELQLLQQLDSENDWRRRVKIAARIISMNLE